MWGAAGAVGRMLVAILAGQQVKVIGIAGGKRVDAARAAGAIHVIDRAVDDVREAVHASTGGRGVAAVFDPIGAERPGNPAFSRLNHDESPITEHRMVVRGSPRRWEPEGFQIHLAGLSPYPEMCWLKEASGSRGS